MLKTLLLYPMELAYTRLAADATPRGQPVHYFGMLHCIVQVALPACASPGFQASWTMLGLLATAGST